MVRNPKHAGRPQYNFFIMNGQLTLNLLQVVVGNALGL